MPKVSYILICLLCTVYGALSSVGPQKSVQTGTFVQNSGHVRYTSGTRADHVVATHESGPLTTFIHPGGMHLVLYRQTADPHGQPCYDAIRVDAGLLNANPSARFTLTDVASQYHTYIQPSVVQATGQGHVCSRVLCSMKFCRVLTYDIPQLQRASKPTISSTRVPIRQLLRFFTTVQHLLSAMQTAAWNSPPH